MTVYQFLFCCKTTFTAVAIRIKVHAGKNIYHTMNKYVNDCTFFCLQVQSCSAMQWLKCTGVVGRCAAQCRVSHHIRVLPAWELPITDARDAILL